MDSGGIPETPMDEDENDDMRTEDYECTRTSGKPHTLVSPKSSKKALGKIPDVFGADSVMKRKMRQLSSSALLSLETLAANQEVDQRELSAGSKSLNVVGTLRRNHLTAMGRNDDDDDDVDADKSTSGAADFDKDAVLAPLSPTSPQAMRQRFNTFEGDVARRTPSPDPDTSFRRAKSVEETAGSQSKQPWYGREQHFLKATPAILSSSGPLRPLHPSNETKTDVEHERRQTPTVSPTSPSTNSILRARFHALGSSQKELMRGEASPMMGPTQIHKSPQDGSSERDQSPLRASLAASSRLNIMSHSSREGSRQRKPTSLDIECLQDNFSASLPATSPSSAKPMSRPRFISEERRPPSPGGIAASRPRFSSQQNENASATLRHSNSESALRPRFISEERRPPSPGGIAASRPRFISQQNENADLTIRQCSSDSSLRPRFISGEGHQSVRPPSPGARPRFASQQNESADATLRHSTSESALRPRFISEEGHQNVRPPSPGGIAASRPRFISQQNESADLTIRHCSSDSSLHPRFNSQPRSPSPAAAASGELRLPVPLEPNERSFKTLRPLTPGISNVPRPRFASHENERERTTSTGGSGLQRPRFASQENEHSITSPTIIGASTLQRPRFASQENERERTTSTGDSTPQRPRFASQQDERNTTSPTVTGGSALQRPRFFSQENEQKNVSPTTAAGNRGTPLRLSRFSSQQQDDESRQPRSPILLSARPRFISQEMDKRTSELPTSVGSTSASPDDRFASPQVDQYATTPMSVGSSNSWSAIMSFDQQQQLARQPTTPLAAKEDPPTDVGMHEGEARAHSSFSHHSDVARSSLSMLRSMPFRRTQSADVRGRVSSEVDDKELEEVDAYKAHVPEPREGFQSVGDGTRRTLTLSIPSGLNSETLRKKRHFTQSLSRSPPSFLAQAASRTPTLGGGGAAQIDHHGSGQSDHSQIDQSSAYDFLEVDAGYVGDANTSNKRVPLTVPGNNNNNASPSSSSASSSPSPTSPPPSTSSRRPTSAKPRSEFLYDMSDGDDMTSMSSRTTKPSSSCLNPSPKHMQMLSSSLGDARGTMPHFPPSWGDATRNTHGNSTGNIYGDATGSVKSHFRAKEIVPFGRCSSEGSQPAVLPPTIDDLIRSLRSSPPSGQSWLSEAGLEDVESDQGGKSQDDNDEKDNHHHLLHHHHVDESYQEQGGHAVASTATSIEVSGSASSIGMQPSSVSHGSSAHSRTLNSPTSAYGATLLISDANSDSLTRMHDGNKITTSAQQHSPSDSVKYPSNKTDQVQNADEDDEDSKKKRVPILPRTDGAGLKSRMYMNPRTGSDGALVNLAGHHEADDVKSFYVHPTDVPQDKLRRSSAGGGGSPHPVHCLLKRSVTMSQDVIRERDAVLWEWRKCDPGWKDDARTAAKTAAAAAAAVVAACDGDGEDSDSVSACKSPAHPNKQGGKAESRRGKKEVLATSKVRERIMEVKSRYARADATWGTHDGVQPLRSAGRWEEIFASRRPRIGKSAPRDKEVEGRDV